jgi:hypothetical protein
LGFVVVWVSSDQDGDGSGIYAQRYDRACRRVGNEFRVNTYRTSAQQNPSIGGLSDGGFIIAWESGKPADGEGIYAQRYDSSGKRVGGEFHVNTYVTNEQSHPSVAGMKKGGFVVTWASDGRDGSYFGVYAQRYDSAGKRIGREFRVNTFTNGSQYFPSVAGLVDGGFVVSWVSTQQNNSVYGQRYDKAGKRVGTEFRVTTTLKGQETYPSAAALKAGGYIVTWQTYGQDGDGYGVAGQLFSK